MYRFDKKNNPTPWLNVKPNEQIKVSMKHIPMWLATIIVSTDNQISVDNFNTSHVLYYLSSFILQQWISPSWKLTDQTSTEAK